MELPGPRRIDRWRPDVSRYLDRLPGELELLLDRVPGRGRRRAALRAERAHQPGPQDQHPDDICVGFAARFPGRLRDRPVPDHRQRGLAGYGLLVRVPVGPAGEAPAEELLLDLEEAVERSLDLAGVTQALPRSRR